MPGRMLTLACKREKWGECDRLSPSTRMFHLQNNTTMEEKKEMTAEEYEAWAEEQLEWLAEMGR